MICLFARKSMLVMMSRVLNSLILFVSLLFITRNLGPDVYGAIAYSVALVGFFNLIADLGTDYANQKYISAGYPLNDCFSTYLVIKIFLVVVMAIMFLSFLSLGFIFSVVPQYDNYIILVIFLIYYIVFDFASTAINTFNGLTQNATSEIIFLSEKIIRLPLIIYVSINYLGVLELAIAYLIGSVFFLIVAIIMLNRNGIRIVKPTLFYKYLSFAIPMASISIVNIIYVNIDKIIIGIFYKNSIVGFYSAGQNLLSFLLIIGFAVGIVLFPTISNLYEKKDLISISIIMNILTKYVLIIAIPPVIIIFMFPYEISTIIFGIDFARSANSIRYLSLAAICNIFVIIYINQMNAMNKARLSFKFLLIALIINLLIMIISVPTQIFNIGLLGLQEEGAALANFIFMLTAFIFLRGASNNTINLEKLPKLSLSLSIIITSLFFIIFNSILPISNVIILFVYFIFSYLVMGILLTIFGVFVKDDLNTLKTVLNPKKMGEYINNEIKKS